MDLKDIIYQIVSRWEKTKESIATEEATKNALIMPMIMAWGYDVFNPDEVLPEMTCDIGTKKGERIDYAIMNNGEPQILIECKHWGQNLNLHDNQLLRYFNVSKAKFGVLTNGLEYRFYTDLNKPNVMDEVPFLSFDLRKIKESQIEELKKFHKSSFDLENILNSASELKYMGQLKDILKTEFAEPTPELTKYFAKQIYEGLYTAKVSEQMQPLVKKAIQSYIGDQISNKLSAALENNEKIELQNVIPNVNDTQSELHVDENKEANDGIVTTQEEIDAFNIIKAILRKDVDVSRIAMKDAMSYCAILFDNNNRKPITRLYFNNIKNLRIALFNEEGKEEKFNLESLDALFDYEDKLREILKRYL